VQVPEMKIVVRQLNRILLQPYDGRIAAPAHQQGIVAVD
jgi:nitrate reductase beta subunit